MTARLEQNPTEHALGTSAVRFGSGERSPRGRWWLAGDLDVVFFTSQRNALPGRQLLACMTDLPAPQ